MKIAIVSPGLSDGGAERVASIIANGLCNNGHQVLFVAAFSPDREYELDERISYIHIECDKKNAVTRLVDRSKKIEDVINNFDADYIISFIVREMIRCNFKGNTPIVYSLRIDPAVATKGLLNKCIFQYSYSRAKTVVFQTNDAKNFFNSNIKKKGVVIGNPITPNLPLWNSESHKKRIITACRLTKQKNLPMLVKAFAKFHQVNPDYSLEIYGKGPEKDGLVELCKIIGVDKFVSFPGHSDQIHSIMADSAIFVLSSDFEGLSNSMLEALAIGLPTVCTDCPPGGAAEYITDGKNGFLVPVGDVESLYEKLCIMAEKPELCTSMSFNSIKIREILDEVSVVKQWERCLEP